MEHKERFERELAEIGNTAAARVMELEAQLTAAQGEPKLQHAGSAAANSAEADGVGNETEAAPPQNEHQWAANSAPAPSRRTVSFGDGRLGLDFMQQDDGSMMVHQVSLQAEAQGVQPGECIVAVNGVELDGDMSQDDVIELVMAVERPFTITFDSYHDNSGGDGYEGGGYEGGGYEGGGYEAGGYEGGGYEAGGYEGAGYEGAGYGGGGGSSYEGASANAADTAHNATTTQDARYDNYENVLTQLRHHQDDE